MRGELKGYPIPAANVDDQAVRLLLFGRPHRLTRRMTQQHPQRQPVLPILPNWLPRLLIIRRQDLDGVQFGEMFLDERRVVQIHLALVNEL